MCVNTHLFPHLASAGVVGDGKECLPAQSASHPCFPNGQALRAGTWIGPPWSLEWCFNNHQTSGNLRVPENAPGRREQRMGSLVLLGPTGPDPGPSRSFSRSCGTAAPPLDPSSLPLAPAAPVLLQSSHQRFAVPLSLPRLSKGALPRSYFYLVKSRQPPSFCSPLLSPSLLPFLFPSPFPSLLPPFFSFPSVLHFLKAAGVLESTCTLLLAPEKSLSLVTSDYYRFTITAISQNQHERTAV